ncbi:uncharacterized protein TNIN_101291 [Trichonephila inaurata madagascariensis]|uniref:Uncharacterized protein n=1 Tax=Trichonephila inaurata madagascariensis TaxID=2747483 RepID=A0A8X7CR08_9ARAC|nr:uncharacterized protein TNIN_101291 [Trichonephila inaurata madagascariensis]
METQDFEKWYNAEQAQEFLAIFKKIVRTKNQIHFEKLFNDLKAVLDDKIKNQLPTLTTNQKLDFFRKRPNFFVIQGHFVSKFRKSDLSITEAIKKFYSATHFILQSYQPLHFLEIKKCITFFFEDVAHYIMKLSSEKEKELLKNIHNVNIDDSGVLTLTTPSKICTEHISPEDKYLITIAFYLKLHGRTNFRKVVQELKKLKRKEFDAFCNLSESELLKWPRKFGDYFKIFEDGSINLCDEYFSYECDYQKLSHQYLSAHDFYSQSQENDHVNNSMPSYNSISNSDKILTNNMNILKDENLTLEKKLYCSVLFLLSCFDPMHYLEIKECILFTMQDVSKILRKIHHANLQETFRNIPFTVMDENGFLEITKECQIKTNISNEDMIKLFVIYYLGYCGKTHYTKLVKEFIKRAPEPVSVVISALTASKQKRFFKKFAQFFQINKKGYLKVNSSFNLPYCEYYEVDKSYSKKDNSSVKGSNNIAEKNKQTLVFEDLSKPLRGNCAITKKIRCSIAYLLKFFELKISIKLFCIILHVLKDVKTNFLKLSALHQADLIKEAILPFSLNEKNVISPIFNQLEANCLTKKEMELLFFAYYFFQFEYAKIRYNTAIEIYHTWHGKNPIGVKSDPDKYWFFKKSKSMFTVGNYGLVRLCPLPVLKLRADFFSTTENVERVLNSCDSEYSLNYNKQCNLDYTDQYKSELSLKNVAFEKKLDKKENFSYILNNFNNYKETEKTVLPLTKQKDSDISRVSCDQKVSGAKEEHYKECVQLEKHVPPSTNTDETEDICGEKNQIIKDDKHVENEQIKVSEKIGNVKTKNFDRSVQYNESLIPSMKVNKIVIIKETEKTTQLDAKCFIPSEENFIPKIDWIIEKMCNFKDTYSWDSNKLNASIIHPVNVETQNFQKNKSFESEEKCAEEVLPTSSKEMIISPNDSLNKSNNSQNCSNEHILGEKRMLSNSCKKIVRKIVNSLSFLVKYFDCIVDWYLVRLVFQVVTEIRFKFLCMPKSNQISILQKVFEHFTSSLKKTDPDKLFFIKDKLSDEEENLLFMAYVISSEGKLHYKKLYKKFFRHNKVMPTWMKTTSSALNHIGSLDYLFLIKSGCLELQPFEVPELDVKNFPEISKFKHFDKNTNKTTAVVPLCSEKDSEKKIQTCSNNSSVTHCTKTILKNLDSGYLSRKIQAGVIFILQYYHLQAEVLLLKVLLHALDKNQIYVNLSDEDQTKFLRNCFRIFSIDKESVVLPSFSNAPGVQLKKEEKTLLVVIFMLCKHTKLHCHDIFKELKNQVLIPFTDKEQFHYFKKRSDHFHIENTGDVSLKNLPDIKLNEFQFHDFFQIIAMDSVDNYPINAIIAPSSNLHRAYGVSLNEESNVNWKNLDLSKQNHKIQHAMDQMAKDNFSECEKMSKMHDKMKSAVVFLSNYFELEFGSHIICILLHALKDVRNYFLSLHESDKNKFVQKSPFLVNNNHTSNDAYSSLFYLSNNEEDMLFLVYILSHENKLHSLEIFDIYTFCGRKKPVTLATHIELYKYFSKSKEFTLDSNGFVKLNKRFVIGRNSTISSVNCISPYAVPSKSSTIISTSNRESGIINALKNKTFMTGNLILDENVKRSKSLGAMYGYIKESSIFLCNLFKSYPHEHIVRTILYTLNHNEKFCGNGCVKVFFNFDINVKKHESLKYSLSEEEKDLLIFTCELMHLGPTHYSILFKQLQNRNFRKSLTYLKQKYVLKRSNYFIFSGEEFVSLCDIPCIIGVNLNNFVFKGENTAVLNSEYHEEKIDPYCDEMIDSYIQSLNKKYQEHSKTNKKETSVNLLKINAKKESKNSNTSPATYKTPGACKFPNISKTEAELRCMNFFTILLRNVEMAASPRKYFHWASEEVQNHIRDNYGGDLYLFLHIHEMTGALPLDSVKH